MTFLPPLPDEQGPPPGSAEEWELLMERDEILRQRYDDHPGDMIEVADDPFAGLDLDSAYAELEDIERG